MTAPNGMETRAVGRIVTLAMNHACWMNSLTWNGRLGRARNTSRASAKSEPDWRRAPVRGAATSAHPRPDTGDAGVARLEGPRWRGDAVVPAPAAGGSLGATRRAVARRELERDRRQRRQLLTGLGGQLVGVLLLRHADRADRLCVEELPHDGLLRAEQHLARPEHREVLVVEQADVVGHRPGRVDVVGDDEERRVDLRVEVDEELVDVARAHRVEARVRLVDEQDLGVEHEGPGEPGALAHAARDLTGELALGAGEADEVHLLGDDAPDLRLGLLRVLAQREGDVVVERHRAEEGTVLEEDAEELAHLVEVGLAQARQVTAVDDDRPGVGLEQPDERLEEDGLAGARGPEHDRHLPRGKREGHVPPDRLRTEGLGQTCDRDLHTHVASTYVFLAVSTRLRGKRGRRAEVTRESGSPGREGSARLTCARHVEPGGCVRAEL